MSLTGDKERKLNAKEKALGVRIFRDSIDWDDVRISNGAGLGNRPWTNAGIGQDTMHLTPTHYAHPPEDLLVHELTHVWQGQNGGITGLGYKFDSAINQGIAEITGGSAYKYDERLLGKLGWDFFGAEAQAEIVEHWFENGEKKSDPRYPYIKWVIRRRMWAGMWPPPTY